MQFQTISVLILYSFVVCFTNALSTIDFPKDHHFNCLDLFNNERCTKSTRKVHAYESKLNKCVQRSWHGCSTGNMFYDAENCNNACTLCIREDGEQAEYMGFKHFSDALSPRNRTKFYQLLNTLESQLRMLSDQDSLLAQRAKNEVNGDEDESDTELVPPSSRVARSYQDASIINADVNNNNEKQHDVNNKNDDNHENEQDNENPEDDDNWEDENSEWDNAE